MKKEGNITSNLVRKKRKVTRLSKTPNLMQKRSRVPIWRENPKSRVKEKRNITSNLVRKSEEIARSSRTLSLVRKRVKVLILEEFQTSFGRGKEC